MKGRRSSMEIHSVTNQHVKQWMKYKEKKHRECYRRFLIEGEHMLQEAHAAGIVEEIIVLEDRQCAYSYQTYTVTTQIMKKFSTSVSGTWIMAVCHYPTYSLDALGTRIILLDDVQDPGNVGTIIRSALSFGFDSVVLSDKCVDIYNEKVLRSTQGALFHLPVVHMELASFITHAQGKHIPVYATALHNAMPLSTIPASEQIALIFGNEGRGVSPACIHMADDRIYIEMHAFESLNVAVAAGICMYHFRRK